MHALMSLFMVVQADYEQQLLEGQLAAEQHAQQLWEEASARHVEELAEAEQETARLRGDAVVLQGMTAEELQVLAGELEGALTAVRVAQVSWQRSLLTEGCTIGTAQPKTSWYKAWATSLHSPAICTDALEIFNGCFL